MREDRARCIDVVTLQAKVALAHDGVHVRRREPFPMPRVEQVAFIGKLIDRIDRKLRCTPVELHIIGGNVAIRLYDYHAALRAFSCQYANAWEISFRSIEDR